MYPVSQKFHDIIRRDGTPTRLRVYLFDDSVDPTDDNDVQTNGTLLKMDDSDTDSNHRIEAAGVSWTDIFNSNINPQIGACVSEHFGFGLINTDGAYSTYPFSRCKLYLDAQDELTREWYSCPMGVYKIETPAQTYSSVIGISGYDMMQDMNGVADTWFNAIDYTTPKTIADILSALATATGKTVKPSTLTNLINKNVSFSSAPFVSVERTNKDILAWIAEISCSIARFDRDGYLELRWFDEAKIGDAIHAINVDAMGCGVYDIMCGSYAVAQIDGLQARSVRLDDPVLIGYTNSVYQILSNPFIADDNETDVENKLTPILSKLSSLGVYSPIQLEVICDPSVEAGDIINVIYGGTTYRMPIFQKKMVWRGSYVMGNLVSSGQSSMPLSVSAQERTDYRTEKDLTESVSYDELENGAGSDIINEHIENSDWIQETAENIVSEALQEYPTTADVEQLTTQIRAEFAQLASEVSLQINTIEQGVTHNADGIGNVNTVLAEYNAWFRFLAQTAEQNAGLVIGESSSPIQMKLENDVLYFCTDPVNVSPQTAIAYFSAGQLYVNFVTASSLTVGSSGSYLDVRIVGTGVNTCAFFVGRIS